MEYWKDFVGTNQPYKDWYDKATTDSAPTGIEPLTWYESATNACILNV